MSTNLIVKRNRIFLFFLENDEQVIKWLRPAPRQFRIYWDNNTKLYEPDFIVETNETIYMIEVKRADQLEEGTVLAKKLAAERFCKYATEFTTANQGKQWKYIILPHDIISRTVNFSYLQNKS